MDALDDEVESILYVAREISVYKIPHLKANEGHRANDWGDLAKPLWKGRLRIIEKSSGAVLMFEDAQTGELFARAPYDPLKPCVEAVLDSSRYFVIRVEDNGKKAFIGMGFTERTDSFDFNVALQDHTKRSKAALNPPSPSEESPSPHVAVGPKKDYSLKEGQTFSISIPGKTSKPSTGTNLLGSSTQSTGISGGAVPLLPPPPSSARRK
ncbi:adaptin ear-binding coat-associated protein 1 NECAP-1 [Rhizopogon vinicolor AM-OR11-026]|uniref:Adaptin ear-binding coat-associated protein 1 NECAP-1 n=1 Tax=Rhizopogon vinicolor AM-OR11-026 TaxID=1314800 RepID=A0A1B7N644_9AGAM|nr:adaptin ear-binding coat-associated protein 1 NECAP-1 [Rhizopogon vinicolor AM-OR11-026]